MNVSRQRRCWSTCASLLGGARLAAAASASSSVPCPCACQRFILEPESTLELLVLAVRAVNSAHQNKKRTAAVVCLRGLDILVIWMSSRSLIVPRTVLIL